MEVDVPAAVFTLSAALSTLEAAFEPLAATPLKDLLNNEEPDLQMDPIEQARTQILTAYLVHDLIWSKSGFLRCRRGRDLRNFGIRPVKAGMWIGSRRTAKGTFSNRMLIIDLVGAQCT